MLKFVYPICCGMDVHKSFLIACIAATNDKGMTTYKKKRFSTFTYDLRRCASWLAENNCADVCMEWHHTFCRVSCFGEHPRISEEYKKTAQPPYFFGS